MIMEQFRTDSDERAVSPVIGVILMVAITVILAAVIGTFVLGLGGQVSQTAPQASITMSDANDNVGGADGSSNYSAVSISHDGGDEFDAADVEIVVRDTASDTVISRLSGNYEDNLEDLNVTYNGISQSFSQKTFATGDTIVVRDNMNGSLNQTFTADSKYEFVIVDQETGQQVASSTVTIE